jgi:hypothetical protein
MTNAEQANVDKKPYTKPTLTEVRLVAEEAVLGFCKDGALGTEPGCGPEGCNQTQRS